MLSSNVATKIPASALEQLERHYLPYIPKGQKPILDEVYKLWSIEQPLKDKKILLNAHITLITLDLIRLFIIAGAQEVSVTASADLVVHDNAKAGIKAAGLDFYHQKLDKPIPENKKHKYFDIVYDCGAGMLGIVTPKLGMVELTQTAKELYDSIDFPVITVDTTETKKIETKRGTGDALCRFIIEESKNTIMDLARICLPFLELNNDNNSTNNCSSNQDSQTSDEDSQEERDGRLRVFKRFVPLININSWIESKFLVVGCGKVGTGIVLALKKHGVSKENIYIAEVSIAKHNELTDEGYKVFHLPSTQHLKVLKDHLKKAGHIGYVVTATGRPGTMSQYFSPEDFHENTRLINMGTHDEWGERFQPIRIENDKRPANFRLDYPTEIRFLDGTFALYALGAIPLAQRAFIFEYMSERKEIEKSPTINQQLFNPENNLDTKTMQLASIDCKSAPLIPRTVLENGRNDGTLTHADREISFWWRDLWPVTLQESQTSEKQYTKTISAKKRKQYRSDSLSSSRSSNSDTYSSDEEHTSKKSNNSEFNRIFSQVGDGRLYPSIMWQPTTTIDPGQRVIEQSKRSVN